MSELTNAKASRGNFRRQLLATASALALLSSTYGTRGAEASDVDNSPIWIELGGQFDQMDAGQTSWSQPSSVFGSLTSPPLATPPPTSVGAIPHIGFDVNGKISYAPDGSEWVLSASVLYGRASRGPKSFRDQNQTYAKYGKPITPAFIATLAEATDRHTILDFSAGKDVGLGMGAGSRSIVDFGVRIAQFSSRLDASVNSGHRTSVPTPHGGNGQVGSAPAKAAFSGYAAVRHSFTGIGPSISWDASAPVLGQPENGFSFDWNADAAILFGRQSTTAITKTHATQNFYSAVDEDRKTHSHQSHQTIARKKNALVPNVGGLVGFSYHRSNAKISFGYRADLFFGAMDGGIESRKTYNRGFYGPFANVSIGIGG